MTAQAELLLLNASRAQLVEEIGALRAVLNGKEQQLLATSGEDRSRFAEWLRQPDAGLVQVIREAAVVGAVDEHVAVDPAPDVVPVLEGLGPRLLDVVEAGDHRHAFRRAASRAA